MNPTQHFIPSSDKLLLRI